MRVGGGGLSWRQAGRAARGCRQGAQAGGAGALGAQMRRPRVCLHACMCAAACSANPLPTLISSSLFEMGVPAGRGRGQAGTRYCGPSAAGGRRADRPQCCRAAVPRTHPLPPPPTCDHPGVAAPQAGRHHRRHAGAVSYQLSLIQYHAAGGQGGAAVRCITPCQPCRAHQHTSCRACTACMTHRQNPNWCSSEVWLPDAYSWSRSCS